MDASISSESASAAEEGSDAFVTPDEPSTPSMSIANETAPRPVETTPRQDDPEANATDDDDDNSLQYPKAHVVALVMLSIYLAILLVALDRTIISTAIPRITDQFHALNDVGWYGSAYMLTSCSFQLSFGRLYTYYSPKWVLVVAITLFEIGSAICGAAPNSTAFIIGRAVAGVGSAGIYAGAVIIIVYTVPLRKRPLYTGTLGAIYGVASVAGPLLGGVFTNDVSWRWCFYINLPIGAVTILVLILALKLPNPPLSSATGLTQKLNQLDPIGTFLFLPGVICLLLALQWGGTTYPWSNPRIITLLVLFGVLMALFVAVQLGHKDSGGLLPLSLLKQRSLASGTVFSACVGGSLLLLVYYLPIWFQAVKGVSAVKSGVDIIPVLLGLFVASLLAGALTTLIGYYTPFMLAGCVVMSLGAGLLTTLTPDTNHAKWIGYQALFGLGTGLGFQQPSVAAQATLSRKDVPTGSCLVMFAQSLGGAVSVSIGGSVFTTRVVDALAGIPNLNTTTVIDSGATELSRVIPRQYIRVVQEAYSAGLTSAFKVGLAFAGVSVVGALGMEWVSVKKEEEGRQGVVEVVERGENVEGGSGEGEEGAAEGVNDSAKDSKQGVPVVTKEEEGEEETQTRDQEKLDTFVDEETMRDALEESNKTLSEDRSVSEKTEVLATDSGDSCSREED